MELIILAKFILREPRSLMNAEYVIGPIGLEEFERPTKYI